jgi:hypothetical protein
MAYLHEFRRLVGVSPSLMEAEAGLPSAMLDQLAKAFSTRVSLPDVKFIRYRKFRDGVELEDEAERLGGILTSVESNEADSNRLVAFLKKHGAKPMAKTESADVGHTIYQQLGGNRIMAMLGRKLIVLTMKNGLMLKWPSKEKSKGNCVRITLREDDTYDVEFLWVSTDGSSKSLKTFNAVMADGLRRTFEEWTGLRLSLGSLKKEEHGAPVIDEAGELDPVLAKIGVGTKITLLRQRIYGDDSHGSSAAERESVKTVTKVSTSNKPDAILVRFKEGQQGGGKTFSGTEYSKASSGRSFKISKGQTKYWAFSGPPKPVKYIVIAIDGQDVGTPTKESVEPVVESDEPGSPDKFKTGSNKLDSAVKWLLAKAKRSELSDGTIEYDFRGKLPRQMTLAFIDAKDKKVLSFEDLQKNVRYTWEKGDVGFTILTGNTMSTQAETRFMAHDYTVPASKQED